MILRNYDNIMLGLSMITKNSITFPHEKVFGDGYITGKTISGNIMNLGFTSNMNNPLSRFSEGAINYADSYRSNLVCGSGDTDVTYDDYCLASPFTTSQVSYVSGVSTESDPKYDAEKQEWTRTYTRNYLANEDITIREIGVYFALTTSDRYLVYRQILETPLEVKAGNQFTLKFTAIYPATPNKPANYEATASVE